MSYGSTLADITLNDVADLEGRFDLSIDYKSGGRYQVQLYDGPEKVAEVVHPTLAVALAAVWVAARHLWDRIGDAGAEESD